MKKTYLDFDSLFDTRIVLLQKMNKKACKQIIKSKSFFTRLDDRFSILDPRFNDDEFKELWAKRSEVIQRDSLTCTLVYSELRKEHMERLNARASGILVDERHLYFNTWPFDLSDSERSEIGDVLLEATGTSKVFFINLGPELITVDYLHASFDQVIMYDLDTWLKLHVTCLKEDPLLKTTFITPLFFKGEQLPTKEIGELINDARELLRPYFDYVPMPSSTFSFATI